MAYTRLNPLKDSFSYSGTATATNSIVILKNAGMLDGTWLVCAIIWPTAANATDLQCRLYGSASGLMMDKRSPTQSVTIVLTVFCQDETMQLETYCPTSTAIGWKFKGIRLE
jgi:hypothetical protein